jgi:hypothetical protein
MDDVTKYFPIFNKFLNEMSYGSISNVEFINVERFLDRTVFIAEHLNLSNLDFVVNERRINCKMVIGVNTYNYGWSHNKTSLEKQFVSMFKRQFKSIDFDHCQIVIESVNMISRY